MVTPVLFTVCTAVWSICTVLAVGVYRSAYHNTQFLHSLRKTSAGVLLQVPNTNGTDLHCSIQEMTRI